MNIALVGRKKSGKDLTASIIKQFINNAKTSAFADHLKNSVAKVLDLPLNYLYDENLKDTDFPEPICVTQDMLLILLKEFTKDSGKDSLKLENGLFDKFYGTRLTSPRMALQFLGTDVLRSVFNENIHCEFLRIHDETIVTDVRFKNEFNFVKSLGFVTIGLKRNIDTGTGSNHLSETQVDSFIDDCDVVINNNGSIEDLTLSIKTVLKNLEII